MFRWGLGLIRVLVLVGVFLALPVAGSARESSLVTSVNVTARAMFSMEFYVDENVIYSTTVPFSSVDPAKSLVYPNGRKENDGKSDTGVVGISNIGVPWYLKIQGSYSEEMPEDSVKYYYSQPWDRNSGFQTGEGLTNTAQWRSIPTEATTIYTSGSADTINSPFGTLSTFSFAVDPRGLSAGQTYTVSITYTMTTAP